MTARFRLGGGDTFPLPLGCDDPVPRSQRNGQEIHDKWNQFHGDGNILADFAGLGVPSFHPTQGRRFHAALLEILDINIGGTATDSNNPMPFDDLMDPLN
jgi:hypothetical protein